MASNPNMPRAGMPFVPERDEAEPVGNEVEPVVSGVGAEATGEPIEINISGHDEVTESGEVRAVVDEAPEMPDVSTAGEVATEADANGADAEVSGVGVGVEAQDETLADLAKDMNVVGYKTKQERVDTLARRMGIKDFYDAQEKHKAENKEKRGFEWLKGKATNFIKYGVLHAYNLQKYIATNREALDRVIEGGKIGKHDRVGREAEKQLAGMQERFETAAGEKAEDQEMILREGESLTKVNQSSEKFQNVAGIMKMAAEMSQQGHDEQAVREYVSQQIEAYKQSGEWSADDEKLHLDFEKSINAAVALGNHFRGVDKAGEKINEFIDQNFSMSIGENAQMGQGVEQTLEAKRAKSNVLAREIGAAFGGLLGGSAAGALIGNVLKGGSRTAAAIGMRRALTIIGGAVGGAVAGAVIGYGRGTRRHEEQMILNEMRAEEGAEVAEENAAETEQAPEDYTGELFHGEKDARYGGMERFDLHKVTDNLAECAELELFDADGNPNRENITKAKAYLVEAMRLRKLESDGYWVFRGGDEMMRTEMGKQMLAVRQKLNDANISNEMIQGEVEAATQHHEAEMQDMRKQIVRDRRHAGYVSAAVGGVIGGAMGAGAGAAIGEVAVHIGNMAGDAVDTMGEAVSTVVGGEGLVHNAIGLATEDIDGDGFFELIDDNGEKVLGGIQFDATTGTLTEESQARLADEGWSVAGDEVVGKTALSPAEQMSLNDYIETHPGATQEITAVGNNSGELQLSQVMADINDTGDYVVAVTHPDGSPVDVSSLRCAIDLGGEGNEAFVLDVETNDAGQAIIRIPDESPVASAITKADGMNGVFEFNAESVRVGEIAADGKMNVMGAMPQGSGINAVNVYTPIEQHNITITNAAGEAYAFTTPKVTPEYILTGEVWNMEGPSVGVRDGATGEIVQLRDIDPTEHYVAEDDPYTAAGNMQSNHFGASTYREGANSVELLQDTAGQMSRSPEETELLRTALGMEGATSDLDVLNKAADEMAAADNYAERMDAVYDELQARLDGGTVNTVNLTDTGYERTVYMYNGAMMTQHINGVDGHALELLDKSGHNILDSTEIRDMYGIPHDAAGRFMIRMDCGGQIVWVPGGSVDIDTGAEGVGTGDEGTGDEGTGNEGTGDEGTGDEGTGDEGTGDEGTGDEGTGDEGTGNEGTGEEDTGEEDTGNEGTGEEGTGDEGTGDEGTGDEGTGNEGTGDEGTGDESTGDELADKGDNTGMDRGVVDHPTEYSDEFEEAPEETDTGDHKFGEQPTGEGKVEDMSGAEGGNTVETDNGDGTTTTHVQREGESDEDFQNAIDNGTSQQVSNEAHHADHDEVAAQLGDNDSAVEDAAAAEAAQRAADEAARTEAAPVAPEMGRGSMSDYLNNR